MPFLSFLKQRSLPVILSIVFVAYLPSLKADFVNWDDGVHILQNFSLRSLHWQNLAGIWTSTINHTYIPLTVTTWAMEYHFFGYDPFIFHLDNLFLHLITTALVFIFSEQMALSSMAAALAALIFGIHPIHVESVAWATERKDVLYAALYMGTLVAYLKYIDTDKRKYFGLTIIFGVLSICSKSMAVSLPAVLLALDWFRHRQITSRVIIEKLFCGALLIPIAFITYFPNSHFVHPAMGTGPLVWVWCLMFYLYKFLYPWPMVLFYGLPRSGGIFYLNVLVFLGLLATVWSVRRDRWVTFAFLFYLMNIFILLRFQPILLLVSDRFMYLPSIGFCMLFAVIMERIFFWAQGHQAYLHIVKILLGGLIGLMAIMTWGQCKAWQSSISLWNNQLRYNSRAEPCVAYCKLADAYAAIDKQIPVGSPRFVQVYSLYQKSIDLNPDFAEPYYGLGNLFKSSGDDLHAEHFYKEAIARDRTHSQAFFELGQIYQRKGLPKEAINFYQRAMAATPDNIYICSGIIKAYQGAIMRHDHADIYQEEEDKIPRFI